ncbi:hypothetical protein GCM10009765_02160 [Fodinicola feengrottensis]|uniref:Bacterial transcriptional activator domain-containing protein n=1 Tax=Fodinicola feengrottensis TaxID=435914 RepID=A0ABN2FQ59_9ACTN
MPLSVWRWKKSQELFKFLLSRRNRATSRELLMDVLWPDESSSRVANRLSVALSAVRTVLDPDRVHPADFFVAADRYAVTLSNLAVDAEIFVFHATVALERHYCGDRDAAHALAFAESLYVGDFLPADQCVEWTAPVRETAKANYLEVVRALAKLSADSGQHHLAVRYHLQALQRDAFDEAAHLGLVQAFLTTGRTSAAHRHYRSYVARMAEIGVDPAPPPAVDRLRTRLAG